MAFEMKDDWIIPYYIHTFYYIKKNNEIMFLPNFTVFSYTWQFQWVGQEKRTIQFVGKCDHSIIVQTYILGPRYSGMLRWWDLSFIPSNLYEKHFPAFKWKRNRCSSTLGKLTCCRLFRKKWLWFRSISFVRCSFLLNLHSTIFYVHFYLPVSFSKAISNYASVKEKSQTHIKNVPRIPIHISRIISRW